MASLTPPKKTKQKGIPYSAIEVAKYLIYLASRKTKEGFRGGVTNLKLQKLLYFAQVYYLVKFDKPVFREEIQAWELGPVIPEVYQACKKSGEGKMIKEKDNADIKEEDKEILRKVWNKFGIYTASKLVDIIHSHKPWKRADKNEEITHKQMKDYYKPLFGE